MSSKIIIKSYTKLEFQSWIVKGIKNGLNDSIISKKRAIAQMNNPDASVEDILITTANINKKCIGYRGVFPEKIYFNGKEIKIAWLTTFFVDPNYRGKGIAKKLMEPIVNYYSDGIGSINSSENALKVYKKLGWKTSFITKTKIVFKLPKPRKNTIKNILLNIVRPALNYTIELFHHRWLAKSYKEKYEVEYTELIDNSLYQFIINSERSKIFIKSQEKLNWILKYKWASVAPCLVRTNQKYYFTNYVRNFSQHGSIIKQDGNIIGFFILRNSNKHMAIPFLYYSNKNKENVFRSILEHVIELNSFSLTTSNDDLIKYIVDSNLMYLFKKKKATSFSHTGQKYFESIGTDLQDGDGDLFF